MVRLSRLLLLVLGLLLAFGIFAEETKADDANANAIGAGLQDFVAFADTLSGFEELGEAIPFTDLDPSADDALRLSSLFEDAFAALPASFTNLDALESALEDDLDTNDLGGTGIKIQVGCPLGQGGTCEPPDTPVAVTPDGDPLTLIEVQLPFKATRTVSVPLAFSSDIVNLHGGSLSITFTLETTLNFQLNTTLLATPALAFSILGEPSITLGVTAGGSIGTLTTNLGFAQVTASGDAAFDIDIEAKLDDPDESGKITIDEYTSTSVEDILEYVKFVESPGDAVDVKVNLDTGLISAAKPPECTTGGPDVDACVVLLDDDITTETGSGLAAPSFYLGNLGDFRNFTAADALRALDSLVAMLSGLQATDTLDVELPLLEDTFSEVLTIAKKLQDAAAELRQEDIEATPLNEAEDPTFADALELGEQLATELGLSGAIIPSYIPGTDTVDPGLTYHFVVEDEDSVSVPLDFRGGLDVLSGIEIIAGGSATLGGAYKLDITFGLDLTPQPVEGEGTAADSCEDDADNDGDTKTDEADPDCAVGTCEDGEDNDGDGDVDAADTADCGTLKTIGQRVFLDVGASPELAARLSLAAENVNATARIGMLEAGIENAELSLGSNQQEDTGGAGSCHDGDDNTGGDGADAADDECTFITVDFAESDGDGRLTIQDLFNVIGGNGPSGASLNAQLSASIDGTIPVKATLDGTGLDLAGGNITITGSYDGALTDALTFVNNIDIDASNLALGDLLSFSPCSNAEDDDGDTKINDGCPQVGDTAETGDQCNNDTDDDTGDSDGAVNDGCPAQADPETESLALLDKILALLQALADKLDEVEEDDTLGSSLGDALPLVGTSFEDLLSYADKLEDLIDDVLETGEDPSDCDNATDDDGDTKVNDGCPAQGKAESGTDCDNTADDDSDGLVNDGCGGADDPPIDAQPETTCGESAATCVGDPNPCDDDADTVVNDGCPRVGSSSEGECGASDDAHPAADDDRDGLYNDGCPSRPNPEINECSGVNDGVDNDGDTVADDGCGGGDPAAVNTPEVDQCAGTQVGVDNDSDGVPDDGCDGTIAAVGNVPESGADCRDKDETTDTERDDDRDGYVNDGCPPSTASLQNLQNQIAGLLEDLLEEIPGVDPAATTVTLEMSVDGDKDLKFLLHPHVEFEGSSTFNLDLSALSSIPGLETLEGVNLVALETTGDLGIEVEADLHLDFVLDLDDFQFYLLGSTEFEIQAQADAENLRFDVSLGPLTASVGTDTAVAEDAITDACNSGNTADEDEDGKVNDGCGKVGAIAENAQVIDGKVDVDGDADADDDDDLAALAGKEIIDGKVDISGDGSIAEDDDGSWAGVEVIDGGVDIDDDEDVDTNDDGLLDALCASDQDDDGDGLANDGCPAVADKGRAHVGGKFHIVETHGDNEKVELGSVDFEGPSGPGTALTGLAQASCPTTTDHACAVLPLYFDADGSGPNPPAPLGDATATPPTHHLTVRMTDITDLSSLSLSYLGADQVVSIIAGQVLDLLLLNTGLGRFLEILESLLNGELLGFDLPLIGDKLDEAADYVARLRTDLLGTVTSEMGSDNPLRDAATAQDVENKIQELASKIGEKLDHEDGDAKILLDTNGDTVKDENDFVATAYCNNAPCIAPETACDDATDDDGDTKVNDGCPVEGTDAETACGEDPATCVGDPNPCDDDGDTKVNDGCYYPDGAGPNAWDVDEVRFRAKIGQTAVLSEEYEFDIGIPGLGLSSKGKPSLTAYWQLDIGFGISTEDGFFLLTHDAEGAPETDDECTGANSGVDNDGDTTADDGCLGGPPAVGDHAEGECYANYKDDDGDTVPNDGCPELTLGAGVTLPDELTAILGFLEIKVIDGDPPDTCASVGSGTSTPCMPDGDTPDGKSQFNPKFVVDLKDPGATSDNRLTFAEMTSAPSFGDVLAYQFTAVADINLHIETSIAGESALPKLIGDLNIDWRWKLNPPNGDPDALGSNTGTSCTDDPDHCFEIKINNLVVDAGTFLSKFLGPIVGEVQEYTEPLQPIIDVLKARIPVLSDLAGQPVTLLTLAETFGSIEYIQLIVYVANIIDFVNSINIPDGSGNLTIPIGTGPSGTGPWELDGERLQRGPLPSSEATSAFADPSLLDDLTSLLDDFDSELGDFSNGQARTSSELQTDMGLSFPFLEQPSQLLMMIFGQDVDLILWEGRLQAGFTYNQRFGPIWSLPPVYLEIGGSVSIKGRLAIGYDTQGLREVLFEGAGAGALLHGIFLGDRDASGQDVRELELRGEIRAGASVSLVIFSAGAFGGVGLTIWIDLQDPNNNGKLKFQEIADIIEATSNPFCLFILGGEFGVFVGVYAEVDLFFWSKRWEKILAEIVLLEFEVQCDFNVPPKLASVGSADLILHMGPNSGARGANSVGANATAEEFTVIQEPDGSLTVRAFGFSETHAKPAGGWNQIIANASHTVSDPKDDEDVITLLDGALGGETGAQCDNNTDDDGDTYVNDGCPGVTKIERDAQCADNLDGDVDGPEDSPADGKVNDGCPPKGDLTTVPFSVPAVITGGMGNDKITGGNAGDTIDAGPGNDRVDSRGGADKIIGGLGGDQITSGAGDDYIYGDTSATATIEWNNCGDNAPEDSNDGVDTVEAGLGTDRVCGQGGDDILTGGISNARAVGDAESGEECGNSVDDDDDDVIDDGCVDAWDEIHGGSGEDDISGADGDDKLYGDGDPDNIIGDEGNDTIYGGNESSLGDVLIGGPGADSIYGGDGDDRIVGGNILEGEPDTGDTHLNGEGDHDVILGDNAKFTSTTDPKAFTLLDPSIGGGDTMDGGAGNDVMRGQVGDDTMDGKAGNDNMQGNDGTDTMDGGADNDVMEGNDGTDTMHGGSGADNMKGNDGIDTMNGNAGVDTMRGGRGADIMHGNDDGDYMYGDKGDDDMYGDAGDDYMRGNADKDDMYGGANNDTMHGDAHDDYMEGNGGADTMHGERGQDDMIGGSSTGGLEDDEFDFGGSEGLRGDRMYGDDDQDVMAGDNAQIIRPDGTDPDGSVKRTVTLYDRPSGNSETTVAGDDIMQGNAHNDDMYGGGEDDNMHGNAGDDYMEGNGGDDAMYGDAGQDDMIGGTSQDGGNKPDGGDDMWGGNGSTDLDSDYDVMAGDNASIVRPVDGGNWIKDTFSAEAVNVVRRTITLFDVGEVDSPAGANTSGGDEMDGEAGFDIMYGQGGNDNAMYGGAGDDYMEGNDGNDLMYGEAGQDDLIGGTGRTTSNDPSTAKDGRLDGSDTIYGGDGAGGVTEDDYDVIMGDNATVDRPLDGEGKWELNSFNAAVKRIIRLYDVGELGSPAGAGTSGGDTLSGEVNDDVMYGQGGNDTMNGGPGDDYMEGNADSDTMAGEDDHDDMIGGTARTISNDPSTAVDGRLDAGEFNMTGGDGFDFMAGDNAVIERVLDEEGKWVPNTFRDCDPLELCNGIQHERIQLLDVQDVDDEPPVSPDVSGGDTMFGDDDDDVMYGQGNGADNDDDFDGRIDEDPADGVDNDGDGSTDEDAGGDVMHGGNAEDYMEGNHGADFMYGDAGQDDMIGGTGRVGDDPAEGVDGRLDGDDTMFGESDTSPGTAEGDGADTMTGDNSMIERPLTEGGHWEENSFNSQFTRIVTLLDVETVDNAPLSPDVSGGDDMWGNHNDDIMYGQGGNDDMSGGAGHDYMEGNAASDLMYGDGEDDDMLGGTGPTTSSSQLQELSEVDRATALAGRTDVSTKTRNVPYGTGATGDLLPTSDVPLGDTMYGGEGADVMLGDNGIIIRPLVDEQWSVLDYALLADSDGTGVAPDGSEITRHPADGSGSRIERTAEMMDSAPWSMKDEERCWVAGSDLMFGGPGDDDMYGQFDDTDRVYLTLGDAIGDEMHGDEGEDAMAGDQGLFNNRVLEVGSFQHIEPKEPFIDDDIFIDGTLFREFVLQQIEIGGNDRMRGGSGGDWMHGGAGNDVMNGDDGNDRLFGDDGDDAMWGGSHHDHLWGGFGNVDIDRELRVDHLDVHPRVNEDHDVLDSCDFLHPTDPSVLDPPDPSVWYEFGFEDGLATTTCDGNFEDVDYMYGGWDPDVMQANIGDNGPRIGDRLIDWAGVYNLYVLCPATYGEFVSTRESSPHMTDFIHRLAEGDGAFQPGPADKKGAPTHDSGFNEIAFVYKKDIKLNANPPYEDTPAHFNCSGETLPYTP